MNQQLLGFLKSMIIQFQYIMNNNQKPLSVIQKLSTILKIERKKFEQRGLSNYIIGLIILFAILYSVINFGQKFWPEKVENTGRFIFIGTFAMAIFTTLLSFALFAPGYFAWAPQYFDKYLVNKKSSRPWERKNWDQVKTKTVKNHMINYLIVFPIMVYVSTSTGTKVRFDGFPTFAEFLTHLSIVYLVEDFTFYWVHRTFHQIPFLYKFHKVHHQYDTLYTFATEYLHPVDFIVSHMVPSAVGFGILGARAHAFTLFFWMFWNSMLGYQAHSGYEFPASPMRLVPLVGGASYHDHHHSMNVGNYAGSCYFWDLIFGTNQDYVQKMLKEEKKNPQVQSEKKQKAK